MERRHKGYSHCFEQMRQNFQATIFFREIREMLRHLSFQSDQKANMAGGSMTQTVNFSIQPLRPGPRPGLNVSLFIEFRRALSPRNKTYSNTHNQHNNVFAY